MIKYNGQNISSPVKVNITTPPVVQTTGDSESSVMSQKAVTEALKDYNGFYSSGDLDTFVKDGSYMCNGVFTNSPFEDNTQFILTCSTVDLGDGYTNTLQIAVMRNNDAKMCFRVTHSKSPNKTWHDISPKTSSNSDNGSNVSRSQLAPYFAFNGYVQTEGDLDDYINEGNYVFYGGTYLNSPFADNTQFILSCSSVDLGDGIIQTLQMATPRNNNGGMYYRVAKSNEPNKRWHSLGAGSGAYNGDKNSGDLDTFTNDGIYFCNGIFTNSPFADNTQFLLTCSTVDLGGGYTNTYQTAVMRSNDAKMYFRVTHSKSPNRAWHDISPKTNTSGTVSGSGRNVVNFGDSIFGNHQGDTSVSAKLSALMGVPVINAGLGGTNITDTDGNFGKFSMVKIATAISSGDWSELVANANELAGAEGSPIPAYYKDTIDKLSKTDFSKVTDFTINHGTNDWSRHYNMDNSDNPFDVTTYKGAMRYVIDTLQKKYPNAKVTVISVINRFNDGTYAGDERFNNGTYVGALGESIGRTIANSKGDTLEDYAKSAEEVSKEFFVNYINVFDTLGFNTNNRAYYFGDMTHPNAKGNDVLAEHIAKRL